MSRTTFIATIALAGALLVKAVVTVLFVADGNARAARVALFPRDWDHG